MGGFSHAFWLWFPVLIYKAVSAFCRIIWKFNLWILQTICGVPLYYCKPEYRIPGILFGTLGTFSLFSFVGSFLTIGSETNHNLSQQGIPLAGILIIGAIGIGLLFLCRVLIRKGSI